MIKFCGGKLTETDGREKGCEKNKVKGHKTKVTVKGTYSAICRYTKNTYVINVIFLHLTKKD